jgi:RNA-directed DNA polymerase
MKLWKWCKRRHSEKGNGWIKAKYYATIGNRDWCFTWKKNEKKDVKNLYLKHLSTIKITRNQKIEGAANPYDAQWKQYFEKRETYKMLQTLKGKTTLLRLWEKQKRHCPVCERPINRELPWNTIKTKVNNKVVYSLVHDKCRRSVQYFQRINNEPISK